MSKVVLCGRCSTFASFSQDALQFSWQAQHVRDLCRHFVWHAQHFRRVVLCVSGNIMLGLHARHSTLYTPHLTLQTLHSTLYNQHFTLHTLHFTLNTLHSTLYIPHFAGLGFFATVTGVFGYGAMLEGFFATGNARGFIATVQKVFLQLLWKFFATVNE